MPFLSEQEIDNVTTDPFVKDLVWRVDTSAIVSDMACIGVVGFNLSISKLEKIDYLYAMTDVSLIFEDDDGCVINTSWPFISGVVSPSRNNPTTPNHHFAFWAPYRFLNMTKYFNGELVSEGKVSCVNSIWKSFVIVRPIFSTTGDISLSIRPRKAGPRLNTYRNQDTQKTF